MTADERANRLIFADEWNWIDGDDSRKLEAQIAAAIREAEAAARAEERERSAQTAEWEYRHGTDGMGIAAAIRAGHRRAE